GQDFHGGRVGVRAGRNVVRDGESLHVAHAPKRDEALAVLRRLGGVGRLQRPRGAGVPEEVALVGASVLSLSNLAAAGRAALSGCATSCRWGARRARSAPWGCSDARASP